MTTLTRWDPLNTLTTFQDEMTRLFDDNFYTRARRQPSAITAWAPAVDIFETGHELVLKADLPDLDEKDIDVRVENNMITVSGERKFEKELKEENYLRVERSYGSFSRSFSLPNTVKMDAVLAEYKNGVLTVHLPKREESKPKQIKIGVIKNGK
jgi:HSP20 family protein